MKYLEKAAGILNDIFDGCLVLLCLCVLMIGSYTMYDIYMLYHTADNTSLLRYKPGEEGGTTQDRGELLDEYVAWLSVEGTKIEFPVMQGEDNNEFLNKDPFGNYSLSGSIFLDSRNSPLFTDEYSVIYGHHMSGDAMFGTLDKYLKKGYLEKHREGTLTTKDGVVYLIRLFAVIETDATDAVIFEPGYRSSTEIQEHAKGLALYGKIPVPPGSRMVALTTCRYPNTTLRTVILGTIGEAISTDT